MNAARELSPAASKPHVVIDSEVHVCGLPFAARKRIVQGLTFDNPRYVAAARSKRIPRGIARHVEAWRNDGDALVVPRAALELVARITGAFTHEDRAVALAPIDVKLVKPLRDYQTRVVREIIRWHTGIARVPTGGGKTAIAMGVIAALRLPTLVIVPTLDIVRQFAAACESFLGVQAAILAGGEHAIGPVTIATPQSAARHIDAIRAAFGVVIVDECQHGASDTIRGILDAMPAPYRFGLSATPTRIDGLTGLVTAYLGPVRVSVERDELEDAACLLRPAFERIPTRFTFAYSGPSEWPALVAALAECPDRNALIADAVARECVDGNVGLVLVTRKEHAHALAECITGRGLRCRAVTGDMGPKARASALDAARAGDLDAITATSLGDEGLDVPVLSRLFLTAASKAEPRFVQRAGRILRPHPGKPAPVIFDFVDTNVGVLAYQANVRAGAFRRAFGGQS